MSVYTTHRDSPWVQQPVRGSFAPSASMYSESDHESRMREETLEVQPLELQKQKPHDSLYHACQDQHINDHGPQVRQSRLPIFNQVRSILQRPPPLDTKNLRPAANAPEEVHGDMSRAEDQPVKRRSRSSLLFHVRRRDPAKNLDSKDISPVSVLEGDDDDDECDSGSRRLSQLSNVSATNSRSDQTLCHPSQVSVSTKIKPETRTSASFSIKRKPAPASVLSSAYTHEPGQSPSMHSSPPSRGTTADSVAELPADLRRPTSRFSWTTYGAATTGRPSLDVASQPDRTYPDSPQHMRTQSDESKQPHVSRFSWSTANTNMTNQIRPDSPPASPPPHVPSQYQQPPLQSILSRHRPVQRQDRQDWTPASRRASLNSPGSTYNAYTPTSTTSKLSIVTNGRSFGSESGTPTSARKQLPLPPDMVSPVTPLTHLEALLREQQDREHQQMNTERVIAELVKIETASPMDVPFAQVRHVQKKLEELRLTLAEIKQEHQDIGIAIARARRKEGEEEGLWVRRVTG